ncbi:hypothetical protein QUF74_01640 [Candidatus Halobeggiatoa sp. HSG11]|nr:hypothetical protein [Candidatus Halobeggiatoa sp. HSG11]
MHNNNDFKDLLFKYMGRIRIPNAALACEIDVTRATIGNWKNGTIPGFQSHDKVRKCVKILRLTEQESKEFFKAAGIEQLPEFQQKIVPITGSITHPKQFFGREDVLERIFNNWQQLPLEHVAIIGPEGSGKTSLLNYLKSIHSCSDLRDGQRCNWLKQEYNWVLVDFENIAVQSLEGFLRHVLMELNLPNDTKDLNDLTGILSYNLNEPTIILMDNIKSGLEISELDRRFWQYIRYLGDNNSNLGFCITSSLPLIDLNRWTKDIGKVSPADNIFNEIKLDTFTDNEAKELLNNVPLSKEELEWILKESRCWPVALQILCKAKLEYNENWKEFGLERIKSYLNIE